MTAHPPVAAQSGPRRPRRAVTSLAAVAVLVTGAALTGCAQQRDSDVYTVMNSSTDESYHRWDAEAMARCGKQLGIRIEQQSVPAAQVMTKALRMASSKSLPDIVQFDASEMPTFAEAGGLVDLRTLGLETDEIPEGIVEFGSYRGTYYGAARSVNTLALFYNKDILDRAGIEVPTTWDELRDTAEQLTEGRRYGLALSAGGAEDGVFQFTPFMWSNGGDETELDSPQVVEALDYWKALLQDGSLSRSTVNWTQADVNDQFMAGNAAMMINGPWQVETLNTDESLDWGIAQIPVPQAGDASVGPLGGAVLTVPKTGDEDRERTAGRIVACLAGEKEQLTYALNSWMVPANEKAAAVWRERVPELDALADQVAEARSRTGKLGAGWSSASLALQSAFQSALTGQSSEAALKRAQQRATSGNRGTRP
ncbi:MULTISPECIES: sugar ABC transporter substrate-binding protein [unclassified Streptomyces]|uniref:ABC transporter substrate-binding protein n=1 Tax=unclassified Streptomyces TaxID=2593676 RepID=UPI0005AB31E7|nr:MULTISPECIES: sugar ABC transporter substrate-binding protein [unclassified Streptomyces]ODA71060.1 Maltose/maltodextrin-binding protein precursor [Streptomyces sp. AVP053U2]